MIYARAHDQAVADDYFAAMQRIERRLESGPESDQARLSEVVKVQERAQIFRLAKQLTAPQLALTERLAIADELCGLLGASTGACTICSP